MLVDCLFPQNTILNLISSMNNRSSDPTRIAEGVYGIGHFGSSHWPPKDKFVHDPDLRDDPSEGEPWHSRSSGGVCDSVDDILNLYPILQSPTRQFVITLTKITRDPSNAGRGGGWRWHKWGAYIGKKTPTCEHLDDEPEIDQVFVYRVYEVSGEHSLPGLYDN